MSDFNNECKKLIDYKKEGDSFLLLLSPHEEINSFSLFKSGDYGVAVKNLMKDYYQHLLDNLDGDTDAAYTAMLSIIEEVYEENEQY